jgi:hypothetical protein
MSRKFIIASLGAVAALLVAGCSSTHHAGTDSGVGNAEGSPTAASNQSTSATASGCTGQTLTSTDTGVTPTTITIEVMADTGAASIPGLANGDVEAMKAWAAMVNQQGGLACRKVVIRQFDSKIDPTETAAGYADGCQNSLAMVGTYALAVADVKTLQTCKDKAGAATGLPEVPAAALNPLQACNKTDFVVGGNSAPCPAGTGSQTFSETSAYTDYMKTALKSGSGHGTYYVALTPPVIKDTAVPQYLFMAQSGYKVDQMVGLPATATQANFTPIISKMKQSGSQFYFSDAVFTTFLQAKAEAAAQGVSSKTLWFCQSTCYDPAFPKAGGAAAVGTKVAINTLPFEESDANPEIKLFDGLVKTHNIFSMSGWLSARFFQTAVENLVKAKGPNSLTRANLVTAMAGVSNFTANGLIGPVTPSQRKPAACIVVMNVGSDGAFHREWPTKPGTLGCGKIGTITVDPDKAFKG